ncbi:hypothetical protein CBM2629_B40476 [Cupriavidus taiwanensis]|nr:hypothetical protein CBM2629_B40476 [Cupriavidus taiwanensis]
MDAPALSPAPLPQAGEGSKPATASKLSVRSFAPAFKLPLAYSLSRLRERVGERAGASTK